MVIKFILRHRRKRGFILILTLGMLLMLSMMAVRLITDVGRELRIARAQRDSQAAFNLARAGIARAVNDLQNDSLVDEDKELKQEHPSSTDSMRDFWAQHPSIEEPEELQDGFYWYKTVDEESKMSIYLASPKLIASALIYLGVEEEEDAERLAAAIKDWSDQDGNVALSFMSEETRQSVLEEYEEFRQYVEDDSVDSVDNPRAEQKRPDKIREVKYYGYRNRNEQLMFMDELLEVRGMTPKLLYGYDPETEGIYRDNPFPIKIDEEESVTWRFDDEEREIGLVHLFSAADIRHVNINTVNFDALTVLMMIYTDNDIEKARNIAEDVVKWREEGGFRRFDNANIFYDARDFGNIPELASAIEKINNQHHIIGFTSSSFTIYAFGQYASSRSFLSATVHREIYKYPIGLLEIDEFDVEEERNLKTQQKQAAAAFRGAGGPPGGEEGLPGEEDEYEVPVVICDHWVEW